MFLLNLPHLRIMVQPEQHLHSTMFLLNRLKAAGYDYDKVHLHSTMFLLNSNNDVMYVKSTEFTFHYVSIKS